MEALRPRIRTTVDAGLILFVLTWFMLEAMRIFLASVYAMNVLTVSLNASIAALLLLLAPVAYLLGLSRLRPRALALGSATSFFAFRLLLLAPWPVEVVTLVSGLAVASYLLFLVPYVASNLRLAGGGGTVAAATGLAFGMDTALRVVGNSLDPGASIWSAAFLLPLGTAALYLLFREELPEVDGSGPAFSRTVGLAGLGLGGFLSLTTIVLLYPAFIERWTGEPFAPLLAAVLLGFGTGAYLAKMGLGPGRRAARWSGTLQGVALVATLDLGFGGSPLTFLLAFFASVASVVGLERILSALASVRPSIRGVGWVVFLGSVVYLIVLMAFVFSLTYAYVPASGLWRGHAPLVFIVAAGSLSVPALLLGGVSPSAVPSLASRRWVTGIVAVLLIAAAAGIVATPPAPVQASGSRVVRLMSYNVHQGFSANGTLNVQRIADNIRFVSPDILGLEESDTVRITSGGVDLVHYLASTLGYHAAYGPPTSAQTYGVSILTRFPIKDWTYTLLPSPGDNRVVVHATLAVGGVDVQVFAVHLGLNGTERDAQVAEVLRIAALSPGPRILLGDFNTCPSGLCPEAGATQDHVYASVNASWTDAWASSNPTTPASSGDSYDSLNPFERIDYIFVSGTVSVVRATVVGQCTVQLLATIQLTCMFPPARDASDHLPVLAEVTFA
jgi:endonuclease/exonuclease/phosphatase family metal-dependent hydrolase